MQINNNPPSLTWLFQPFQVPNLQGDNTGRIQLEVRPEGRPSFVIESY